MPTPQLRRVTPAHRRRCRCRPHRLALHRHRARNAIDLLGVGDFEALGVDLRCATEDGSRGHSGRVTDLLRQALDEDPDARVYVCGPTAMMDSAERMLAEAGVPAGAIVSERFRYD